jgi:hypothetical protein
VSGTRKTEPPRPGNGLYDHALTNTLVPVAAWARAVNIAASVMQTIAVFRSATDVFEISITANCVFSLHVNSF